MKKQAPKTKLGSKTKLSEKIKLMLNKKKTRVKKQEKEPIFERPDILDDWCEWHPDVPVG
jgi:hypothetical protein